MRHPVTVRAVLLKLSRFNIFVGAMSGLLLGAVGFIFVTGRVERPGVGLVLGLVCAVLFVGNVVWVRHKVIHDLPRGRWGYLG